MITIPLWTFAILVALSVISILEVLFIISICIIAKIIDCKTGY